MICALWDKELQSLGCSGTSILSHLVFSSQNRARVSQNVRGSSRIGGNYSLNPKSGHKAP